MGDVFNFINLIYSETCFVKQQKPYWFNFNDSTSVFSKNTETGLSDCHKLSTTFCKALSCRILFKYLWLKLAWVTIMNWFQHFVKLFHVGFFSKIRLKLAWVIIINWVQHFVKLFYVGLFQKYLWLKLVCLTIINWVQHFVKLFYVGLFWKILVTETGLLDYHKLSSTFCKALLCRILFKNTCDSNRLERLSQIDFNIFQSPFM